VLATVSYDGLGAAPAGLSLLRVSSSGLGGATCARSATTNAAGYPLDMVTAERFVPADFDGDGLTDVVGLYYNHLTLFHATGPAQFAEATATASYNEYAHLRIDQVTGHTARGLIATTSMDTTMTSTAERYAIDASGVAAGVTIATLNEDGGGFDILRGYAVGDFNDDGFTDVIEVGNHDFSNNTTDPCVIRDRVRSRRAVADIHRNVPQRHLRAARDRLRRPHRRARSRRQRLRPRHLPAAMTRTREWSRCSLHPRSVLHAGA
jgi:hypothetical protein